MYRSHQQCFYVLFGWGVIWSDQSCSHVSPAYEAYVTHWDHSRLTLGLSTSSVFITFFIYPLKPLMGLRTKSSENLYTKHRFALVTSDSLVVPALVGNQPMSSLEDF